MKRIVGITLAACALVGVPSADAATRSCARLVDIGPTGMDPADAVSVRATNLGCHKAREVIGSLARRHGLQTPATVAYGFRCTDTSLSHFLCRKGTQRVTFRLG